MPITIAYHELFSFEGSSELWPSEARGWEAKLREDVVEIPHRSPLNQDVALPLADWFQDEDRDPEMSRAIRYLCKRECELRAEIYGAGSRPYFRFTISGPVSHSNVNGAHDNSTILGAIAEVAKRLIAARKELE